MSEPRASETEVLCACDEDCSLSVENERLRIGIKRAGVSLDQGMSREGVSEQLRELLKA